MIALLRSEVTKLRGSLALLLAVLAPALPGVLTALSMVSSNRVARWSSIFTQFILPIWSLFLLPMVVAAFTTLVAQIEYRARAWDHLLALPVARWKLFAAKAIIVLGVTAAMTVLVLIFTGVGAVVGGSFKGNYPEGPLPWGDLVHRVPLLIAAGTMLVVVQLWTALRFASFVVPLSVGIGGTLVALAVAMTRSDKADWFPWVLPSRLLSSKDPASIALVGGVGGAILLAIMIVDLSRRDFR